MTPAVEAHPSAGAPPDPEPPGDPDLARLEAGLADVDLRRDDINEVFRAAIDLLGHVDRPEEFMAGMLDEFTDRLNDMGSTPLVPPPVEGWNVEARRRLSLLVLYAGQAVLLKDKARLFTRLRDTHQEMELSSERLKSALEESSEARRLLSGVLDTLPLGLAVLDRSGEVFYTNPAMRRLMGTGVGDTAELPSGSVVRDCFELDQALLSASEPHRADLEMPLGDGRIRQIHRILQPLQLMPEDRPGWLLVAQDITEEQQMRDELMRTNRLSAILDTCAALNHEINNPLAAILGRAQMLLARADDHDPRTVAGLRVIEESARRIANLTTQLKEITEPAFTEYSRGVMMLDIKGSQRSPAAR